MTYSNVIEKLSLTRTQATKSTVVATSVVCAIIVLSILAHFLIHPLLIPAQASLFVDYGRLILEGQRPFLDFYDFKSPLLMYLSTLPCLLSIYFPIHPILSFNIFVCFLLTISIALTQAILFKSENREQGVAPYLLVGFALSNFIFIEHFGQLHHLFIIFTLPYFVSRALTNSGHDIDTRLLGIAGLFASVGFGLDLLFFLTWIVFEICLAIEKESLKVFGSMDYKMCMVGLVLIATTFFTLLDDVGMNYTEFPFKLMLLDYDAWNGRLSYFNTTPDLRHFTYFMIISCVLAICFRKYSRLLLPMVLVSVMGFGVLIIQGKMYTYHTMVMMIPSVVMLSSVIGILTNWILKRSGAIKISRLYLVPVVLALSLASYYVFQEVGQVKGTEYISLSDQGYIGSAPVSDLSLFADYVLKNTKLTDNILIINDQVVPAYPLTLQLGRKPVSGFLCTRILKTARQVRFSLPVKVWQMTVLAEDLLWEKLKSNIRSKQNEYIFFNKDAMGPALDEKQVTPLLESFYERVGYLEWQSVDQSSWPEYTGYRTEFHIYKLKERANFL